MLTSILILDTETTGADDGACCVEVAAVLYSVTHAATIAAYRSLIAALDNPAQTINRIPEGLVRAAPAPDVVWPQVHALAAGVDALVSHGADFDRRFVPRDVTTAPWICSMNDLAWPRARRPGDNLVALALAHDLGVSHAHRAMVDCDLLARLFTRVVELGTDLQAFLAHGLRPKARFQALVPFERKDEAREAGFRWNEDGQRRWVRTMAVDDAHALPFPVRVIT